MRTLLTASTWLCAILLGPFCLIGGIAAQSTPLLLAGAAITAYGWLVAWRLRFF